MIPRQWITEGSHVTGERDGKFKTSPVGSPSSPEWNPLKRGSLYCLPQIIRPQLSGAHGLQRNIQV